MKKTRVLVASLVTLMFMMTTVLAGCSGNKKAEDTSSETSGEVVWWGWTPGSPTNEKYIAEFNKEYPNIKVTWKQTSIDDYDAAIRPALANGGGVDAFEVSAGSGNGGVKVFGGQAIDLTDAVKKALGDNYEDKLNKASITTMTVNGQLKALGVGTVYSGNIWINQDLFDKYNVKVPTNLDEWKEACKVFEENGIEGFVQGAGQGAFNIDTFHAIADNVSPGTFTKATRGEVKWTDDSIVKSLELWKGLFDDGIMQKGALGLQQYPDANNLFMSQKAAMVMMGSWYTSNTLPDTMKAAIESASSTEKPFTMIPIDFPDIAGTGKTGSMFGDLDYSTAVSATSKNIKAATTFAVWLGTSQSGQQMIADSLNVVPSLKSATPDWNKVKLVNPDKQNEAIKKYIEKSMKSDDNPRFAGINADMNQKMMDVLAGVAGGSITPKDGAAQLETTQADSK
ncbi:carbohydrate ABC transporter substrate-binding protein [Clostridium chromiireducens]|uniref:Carbohydrate ABC transporter substrate-binding protein n=1 Tax=Clostridium chromiireducens TaxID=225345 RepID=A0A399IH55_9CLOT|nr:ABC transporter substrate-binding protein [Clostridium chromiireducens]RII32273.1 carbohydrate ABC transporter substrate-binding protein [Clostridium chromiireducens]